MEELYKKLSDMLAERFPDQAMRDEAIATMGQIIINESLIEIIESITDEEQRKLFVDAVNSEDSDTAEDIAEHAGVDILAIMQRKSAEVLNTTPS